MATMQWKNDVGLLTAHTSHAMTALSKMCSKSVALAGTPSCTAWSCRLKNSTFLRDSSQT